MKAAQVYEVFHPVRDQISDEVFTPIVPSPEETGYRNKLEFSWGKYISEKEGIHDDYRFGFSCTGAI